MINNTDLNILPPTIWVECGRNIPRYAKQNSLLMKTLHPQINQIMVTDYVRKQDIASFPFFVHRITEEGKSEETLKFEAIKKKFPHKQEYFWMGTTARFFYLYDFMINSNIDKILHLETDCILFSVNGLLELASSDAEFLAYPMQNENLGCASYFFVNSREILKDFLNFILEHWNKDDETDMTLLGKFAISSKVQKLSTWPDVVDGAKVFFDAGTIGPYYLGSDARNFRLPFSRRGRIDSSSGSIMSQIEKRNYDWSIEKTSSGISIELIYQQESYELQNIHIHSKRVYSNVGHTYRQMIKGFRKRPSVVWRIGSPDPIVFCERLISFIHRRVFRLNVYKSVNLR